MVDCDERRPDDHRDAHGAEHDVTLPRDTEPRRTRRLLRDFWISSRGGRFGFRKHERQR